MIYKTDTGKIYEAEGLDIEIIIGLRLNDTSWRDCIKLHNNYLQKKVETEHISNPKRLRSSKQWMEEIEKYWEKYYGYKPHPSTNAAKKLNYERIKEEPLIPFFGVEIEFYSEYDREEILGEFHRQNIPTINGEYRDWQIDAWTIKPDGSIEPPSEEDYISTEIASPILTHDNFDENIEQVCQIINGMYASVNRSCGLHIHFGEHNFTETKRAKIIYEFIKNEETIDEFMPHSRRGKNNTYCEGWENTTSHYQKNLKDKISRIDIENIVNPHGRYKKLNIKTPYATFESRQHSGTTNPTKIIYWKDFLTGLCQNAIDKPFPDEVIPETPAKLVKDISTKLPIQKQSNFISFYMDRMNKFATKRGEQDEYREDDQDLPW